MATKIYNYYDSLKFYLKECQETYDQAVSCLDPKRVKKDKNNLQHNRRKLNGYFLDMKSKESEITIKENSKGGYYLNVPKSCVDEYMGMSMLIKKALGIK